MSKHFFTKSLHLGILRRQGDLMKYIPLIAILIATNAFADTACQQIVTDPKVQEFPLIDFNGKLHAINYQLNTVVESHDDPEDENCSYVTTLIKRCVWENESGFSPITTKVIENEHRCLEIH